MLAIAARFLLGTTPDLVPVAPAGSSPQVAQLDAPPLAPTANPDSPKHAPPTAPAANEPTIVDDDGKSLWVSPTHGPPLDLAYLSPGAQIIIALRPADLLKRPDAEKIRTALGPLGAQAIETVEHVTTIPINEIDHLVVGCQISSAGAWSLTYVVHAARPIPRDALLAKLKDATGKDHEGKKYTLSNGVAYFLPAATVDKVLVAAPEESIEDIIDLGGQTPPLRRDVERLIAATDADRQVTVVFAPNSLFAEGQNLFSGEASRLRNPLFWFLGDELSAAAVSLNWGENFFLELTASPTLDTPPEKASRIFAKRVAEIPARLRAYIKSLQPQPYGQKIIDRFPAMVAKLAKYTRTGLESNRFILRCYLPPAAGHNLLLATELTLDEPEGAAESPASVATTTTSTPQSIKERLAKVTSLKFTKDTLESALDQLSQDIAAPIIIRGPDLQADGITKNQSFGIDLSDKHAEEILVEILHLANPDKTSPGTHDARQKLVYIIEQKPDKTEQIVITTRSKAKVRHNELPEAFRLIKP
ncbi:MAG TPA: hypothetical protein VH107_15315 [Lacipirellulaceae bacterium]|nr:hypothetical protein [Lacipirellulaceae bacterium]